MKKHNTTETYDYKKQKYTVPSGTSKTIPDQGYTLRQILNRFVKGQSITGMGTYNDADYNRGQEIADWKSELNLIQPDPHKMDIEEYRQYKKQAENEIQNINEKTKKQQDKINKENANKYKADNQPQDKTNTETKDESNNKQNNPVK